MKDLKTVKTIVSVIVGASAGAVVGNIIKTTTPADVKVIGKVLTSIGGLVLSSIAGDMASDYCTKKIDEAVESVEDEAEV